MTLTRPAFLTLAGIFLIFVLMSQSYRLNAQDGYYEKVFTTENGLSHNTIFSMAQDTTGFLWFATWDGLSRFDGYDFHKYYHNPDDSTSLPSFSVSIVKVDRHNNVWVMPTAPILALYNRESDDFRTLHIEDDPALSVTGLLAMSISDRGDLWTGGTNGLTVYNHSKKVFQKISVFDQYQNRIENQGANYFNFDGEGHIWFMERSLVYKGKIEYNGDSISVMIHEEYNLPDYNEITFLSQQYNNNNIIADNEGKAWLVTNWGCQPLGKEPGKNFIAYGSEPALTVKGGMPYVWYKHGNYIVVLFSGNTKFTIPLDYGEFPMALTVDKNNSVWYSTINSAGSSTGLHRFDKTPAIFKHYFEQHEGVESAVYSITKDTDGNLLIGSRGNSFVACIKPDGNLRKLNVLSPRESLRTNHVRSMITDSNGVWIGYMHHRLDYLATGTEKAVNYAFTTDTTGIIEPYGFRTLYRDHEGNMLVGTLGLYLYNPQKRLFKKIWPSLLAGPNVFSIRPDKDGNIWAGSSKVLVKLRSNYTVDTVYMVSDIDYSIEDLCFDDEGNLWLALMGGGLEKFDPQTGKREFFTTAHGLSNNTTYNILKDQHGNLWISTDRGISRFDPRTGKFRIYGYTDGLRINEFNSDAAYLAADGQMFFGGMGGVVSFYPDSITSSETVASKCRLLITEFSVSGIRRYFEKPVYDLNLVRLRHGEDNFGVTYTCLNFTNPDKIHYRHRIKEIRTDWIETDYQHRRLNIAGLKPGSYLLEIESTDILGNWNNRIELQIIIPPYFYQTNWFAIIMFILGTAAILALFIYSNRHIRMKEKQKQNYLKLESIRGQMNPHFIFNSLNSINYFIAKNDRLSANRYIASFSKLIRSFLTNMSQEYVPLSDEIESLQEYLRLEFLRFGDKFNYTVNTDKLTDIALWEVFPGMVQPFIENAIWHGVRGLTHRKGFITVSFCADNEYLRCEISDDGIGRFLSKANHNDHNGRKSRGISLVHDRMHIINHLENKKYQVVITDLFPDKKECGTRVWVDIPCRYKVPDFFNPKARKNHDY